MGRKSPHPGRGQIQGRIRERSSDDREEECREGFLYMSSDRRGETNVSTVMQGLVDG